MRSRHVSIEIARTPAEVYSLARDTRRLPEWAAGLAAGTPTVVDDDELVVDSPMGRVRVRFAQRNTLGVLDHEVTLPDGTTTVNPLRVLPHPVGAEVVFTLRQLDAGDDEFERDAAMVADDLTRLRGLLEPAPTPDPPADAVPATARHADTGIRLAETSDAGSVAGLLHDFNSEFDSPTPDPVTSAARFEQLLARPEVLVVVASRAGTDVGFALLTLRPTPYWDGPLAQLEELYVRSDLRSDGIGTRILTRARDEVAARGSREMLINVDADDSGARRFYERHGFSDRDPDSGSGMLCYLQQL